MNPEIALAVDRVRRSREYRETRISQLLVNSAGAAALGPRALEPGARVFDTVTGQEGEVVGRATENIFVPAPDQRAR